MKTYNEMAESALERIQKHKQEKAKRQKTTLGIIIPVFVLLIVAAFSLPSENTIPTVTKDIQNNTSQTTSQPAEQFAYEIDITAEIPAKNTNTVKIASGSTSLMSPYKTDEEKFNVEDSVVIYAKVISSDYVLEGSTVFTKSHLEIVKCYKGNFEAGDRIFVRELGGFVPSDVLGEAINKEKFGSDSDSSDSQSEMLDIRVEGFKVMEKNEEVILFLLPITKSDNEEFEGCYELMRLWQGKLLYDEKYDAFIPYCPSWDLAENNSANADASVKIKNVGENADGAQARAYTLEEFDSFAQQIKK